jgi:hypothetical protein
MLFIAGDQHHLPGPEEMPLPIAINFAFSGMDEHFMFPIMGMPGSMAARGNLKDPHAKILSPVFLADDHPGRNPFGDVAVEKSSIDFGILFNFHKYPPALKSSRFKVQS